MKLGRYIGLGLLALVLIYLGIASYMVLTRTHDPFEDHLISEEAWRGLQAWGGTSFSQDIPYDTRTVTARDGVALTLRVYGPHSDTQIVFLHGVNSNASQLNHAAGLLQAATGAQGMARRAANPIASIISASTKKTWRISWMSCAQPRRRAGCSLRAIPWAAVSRFARSCLRIGLLWMAMCCLRRTLAMARPVTLRALKTKRHTTRKRAMAGSSLIPKRSLAF